MNWIDIVLLVIILLIGFKGFFDGLIHEVSSLVGIVVGIFFASRLALDMGLLFSKYIYPITTPSLCIILGFIIILVCFWVAFLILGVIFSKISKISGLGILDKILGYLFSCVKVFCIFSFIFFALMQINFIREIDFIKTLPQKSKVYAAMIDTANIIIKFANSEEIAKKIHSANKAVDQIVEKTQENISSPIDALQKNKTIKMEKNHVQ